MNKTIYCHNVFSDLDEVLKIYPYTKIIVYPYAEPAELELRVIAVNANMIKEISGNIADFTSRYSKEIKVVIPFNYKLDGCRVYGGAWINDKLIKYEDKHYYSLCKDGTRELCIGIPNSFRNYSNPILESIKTAENLLLAYELYLEGLTKTVEINSFPHGIRGIKAYNKSV